MTNLALPGNPRYQPKDLVPFFGYDNLARYLVQVELAGLFTLAEAGKISASGIALLTLEIEKQLLSITTSEMDKIEREITKHDIRALVRRMQEILPAPLRPWAHVPFTSYDIIDTARTIQFVQSYRVVVRPKIHRLVDALKEQALATGTIVQIGRTHKQHALPITVGFWFATILARVLKNAGKMELYANELVGKISGAVGADNAQVGLGITGNPGVFEYTVLKKVGLKAATISTQILPPEPLAYYLFSCVMLSAALGQLGRDGRNLMSTEIGELAEPFEKGQVGSSTMAHKRNPINFETVEGTWLKNKNEFGKVLDTLISDNQRDLVGSAPARDFPTIIVNVVYQLDTLLRPGKNDPRPFIRRVVIDTEACTRNLKMKGDTILAEPMYLALQMSGYRGDAHELVNHRAMPLVNSATSLVDAVARLAIHDEELRAAWENVPEELIELFKDPANYVGRAQEKVCEVCAVADEYLSQP